MSDRNTERSRYEVAAQRLKGDASRESLSVIDAAPGYLLPPYRRFAAHAASVIGRNTGVLELGAGMGGLTGVLTELSHRVVSLDISATSLSVLRDSLATDVDVVCGDMAALPIRGRSFDVITSAGSLSYADPTELDDEIFRVLRPGGSLLVVDSLNHNPIYRANRWLNYRRGRRTRSTLIRMPTTARINGLLAHFETSSVDYYGSIDFAYPLLTRIIGAGRATSLVTKHGSHGPHSAFKFVALGQGFRAPDS